MDCVISLNRTYNFVRVRIERFQGHHPSTVTLEQLRELMDAEGAEGFLKRELKYNYLMCSAPSCRSSPISVLSLFFARFFVFDIVSKSKPKPSP
jgi:hypothetical protein